MVRLATMNLTLRGLDHVRILRRDALTRSLDRAAKAELGLPTKGFDVVLANPPFSGRLDKDRIVEEVKIGRTAQTELLFLQYMINQLKEGGRCGVVVPEGVLFGSTGAHKELRRRLVENNTVEAVLSLPGRRIQPLFRGQDFGARYTQGRQNKASYVSARRQRRLQAGRKPRPAH